MFEANVKEHHPIVLTNKDKEAAALIGIADYRDYEELTSPVLQRRQRSVSVQD